MITFTFYPNLNVNQRLKAKANLIRTLNGINSL